MRLAKRLTLACSLTAALAAGGASDALASSAGCSSVAPSQRLLVTYTAAPGEANVGRNLLDGGSGDDRMTGDAGNDRIAGGAGGDRLNGGKGHDRLNGGSGRDYIAAADNQRDVVLCGSGDDRVTADHIDVLIGCERVSFR